MATSDIKIIHQVDFGISSLALRSDGIMAARIKANEEIDVKHVIEIVHAMEQVGKGQQFPLLITVGEYTLPTPEARNYIATIASNPFALAEAYVIQSFTQKLVGNVYLNLNKPARPTKLFTSEEKAIEWLETFL